MGRKIITSLYEFIMTQPATKPRPTPVPTAPPKPETPPAPDRPGRPIPVRVPRPDEEEKPMAKNFNGVMSNLKSSIMKERATEMAKNLVQRLKDLKELPQ